MGRGGGDGTAQESPPAPGPAQGYNANIYGGPGGADIFITGAAPGETCMATNDANEALFLDGVVDHTGSLTLYFGTPPGDHTVTVVCDSSGVVAQSVTVT